MRRTLSAAALALALLAGPPVAAEAAIRSTTHCTVKTTWRLAGEDDNADVRVRLWWKPSSKKGWLAFCGEAWDLRKSPYNVNLLMQPNNRAWSGRVGANSVSIRWDAPAADLHTYYVEANLAGDTTTGAVWTVYVR